MSERNTQHDTFTIERRYPVPPRRVFDAFADQAKKARWFGCVEGWEVAEHTIDFRVGGREVWRGGPPGGTQHRNDTVYHDIVPDERIVYTTALFADGVLSTVSLTTVRFESDGDGTRLMLTEQGTLLDDREQPQWREQGTGDWLDALGRQVAGR